MSASALPFLASALGSLAVVILVFAHDLRRGHAWSFIGLIGLLILQGCANRGLVGNPGRNVKFGLTFGGHFGFETFGRHLGSGLGGSGFHKGSGLSGAGIASPQMRPIYKSGSSQHPSGSGGLFRSDEMTDHQEDRNLFAHLARKNPPKFSLFRPSPPFVRFRATS